MKLRKKMTATLLMMVFLASALSITLAPVLAKAEKSDVSWYEGANKAIFLVTSSGLIHQFRYEPNYLHAVYKPLDKFPNYPGEGWVSSTTARITGNGIPVLTDIFGTDLGAQWWVYIDYDYQSD